MIRARPAGRAGRGAAGQARAHRTTSASGFEFSGRRRGRRASPDGNVYVTDRGNYRVQELTATGRIRVDVRLGSQRDHAKANICTAASGIPARPASEGAAPERSRAQSVDGRPEHGNVYVDEDPGPTGACARVHP